MKVYVNTRLTAEFPVIVQNQQILSLFDTGATRSCMSYECYNKLPSRPDMKLLTHINVVSATGNNLLPLGYAEIELQIGSKTFTHKFIVCKTLHQPLIIGLDMQRQYRIGSDWTTSGEMYLHQDQHVLISSIICEPQESNQLLTIKKVCIPPRSVTTLCTTPAHQISSENNVLTISANESLLQENPELTVQQMVHLPHNTGPTMVPVSLVNQSYSRVYIQKGTPIAYLKEVPDMTDDSVVSISSQQLPFTPMNSKLISSPADIDNHPKIRLPDAEVSPGIVNMLNTLCDEYSDIFSTHSGDIGYTKLITMDIDTGDHPPVAQRPYNLPLKHLQWVKEELETLENAGIIARSVSPWASPIVIVPKRSQPGEAPQRRLCVDYRVLNSLLPTVSKAHSRAQGILSLVPLPKIDKLYARLKGSKFFSSLDCTSGYNNIGLSEEAQAKSAFVVQTLGKFEYKRTPFGLAQAPAYFQALMNEVLKGLGFCLAYLDDILIFSSSEEEHLKHLEIVFERLRQAGLKLKHKKCSFFKSQLHYLGHVISGNGIQALPEKLTAIQNMPIPTNPKEVRQVLGLSGYYRKFIPNYGDITRPLTQLTRKETPFIWTSQCQAAFDRLKESLTTEPILSYPDPELPYTLFTDASKYAWSAVLTQPRQHERKGKPNVTVLHPIAYVSGLFRGSQNNWAALTKEAYAIYMAVKKLSFYLEDADITLRSDHLPLKKFLNKVTLNAKVNNWAIELSTYRIKFEFIKGSKNILADSLSRLIDQGITEGLEPEEEGHEFGYYVFDTLPEVEVNSITAIAVNEDNDPIEFTLNLSNEKLKELQKRDAECSKLIKQLEANKLEVRKPYFLDSEGILTKTVIDNDHTFEVTVVPRALTGFILHQSHDALGHNGTQRLYHYLKRLYYWKGLRPDVDKHVKHCLQCRQQNLRPQKYAQLHAEIPSMPMHFLAMDLIGRFPTSSKGNCYALTVIDLLTNFVWCIPIETKTADEVVSAYLKHVFAEYGGSMKILSDNGTEFKNQLFANVAQQLSMKQVFSSPYYPEGNGRIENFHKFLKTCIRKHVNQDIEWDDVTHLACAAYNFVPNQHSKESAFYLMFGRDAYTPLNKLLNPKLRYAGNDRSLLALDVLRHSYALAVHNIKLAREKQEQSLKTYPIPDLTVGDLVLLRNHVRGPWDPRYEPSYRIVKIHGRQLELRSPDGKIRTSNIRDVKPQYPVDDILKHLPDHQAFGRQTKYVAHPNLLQDLGWDLNLEVLPKFTSHIEEKSH